MSQWPVARLGEFVLEAKSGFACGEQDPEGVFQMRMNNITREGALDLRSRRRVPASVKSINDFLVRPGDVLFNATNSPDGVGRSAYFSAVDEPTVFSNHFLRLRVDLQRLDPAFLTRWLNLQFARGVFQAMCRQWVNQATVGRDRLLQMHLPMPPLEEQRRIAAILDQAGELRAKRRAALTLLGEFAAATFWTQIGGPASVAKWPVLPLTDVVRPGTEVTYGIVQAGDEWPGGVPYIRTGDIQGDRIDESKLRHTSPEIASRFARSRVESGDIVMSIRATVGTTALVPASLDGANLTQGTAKIAPGDAVNGVVLLQHLRSATAQRWIQAQVKGATFREITLGRLRQLPVPVPPREVQDHFTRTMRLVEDLRAAQEACTEHGSGLFDALQDRAFKGEL